MNSSANDSFDPNHSSYSGSDGTPDSSSVYAERYSGRSLNDTLLADTIGASKVLFVLKPPAVAPSFSIHPMEWNPRLGLNLPLVRVIRQAQGESCSTKAFRMLSGAQQQEHAKGCGRREGGELL